MRWLWHLIRWLAGFAVFLFLLFGIGLALLALYSPRDARLAAVAIATALAHHQVPFIGAASSAARE